MNITRFGDVFSDGDGDSPTNSVQVANLWYDTRDTFIVPCGRCRKNLPLCGLTMAKIEKGSLDGAFRIRMQTFNVERLRHWAAELESQIDDPKSTDDPKWLQRWADRINRLADRKEQSIEHKQMQSKRQRRQRPEHPDANV